jgi:ABC-type transport system involved in multi-copper enzyme maturation permease subunit
MPIYEQGYTRWEGEIQARPMRFWPILRRGFLAELKRRRTLLLLVLAWSVVLIRGVILYTDLRAGNLLQSSGLLETGLAFFYKALKGQSVFVILFVLLSGTDLVSKDRRFHALQIYFSRPLTPNDYILGKLGIVSAFVFAVSFLPVLLLWIFAISVSVQQGYFAMVWSAPFLALFYCALWAVLAGLMLLMLSSVAQRSAIIAVSWVLLWGLLVVDGVTRILKALTGWSLWSVVNVDANLRQVGAWIFGADRPLGYHPLLSLLVILAVGTICYLILRRRIRPVEVVL